MFLLNSRYPLLSATRRRFRAQAPDVSRYTFFRSYGVILLSSLTTVLSSALVYSTRPPESVCGTVTNETCLEDFLGSMGSTTSRELTQSLVIASRPKKRWIYLPLQPTGLNQDIQHPAGLPSSVSPSLKRFIGGAGILTCFPSPTLFSLGLGTD